MMVHDEYQTRRKVVVDHDIADADFQPDWEDWIDSSNDLPLKKGFSNNIKQNKVLFQVEFDSTRTPRPERI